MYDTYIRLCSNRKTLYFTIELLTFLFFRVIKTIYIDNEMGLHQKSWASIKKAEDHRLERAEQTCMHIINDHSLRKPTVAHPSRQFGCALFHRFW